MTSVRPPSLMSSSPVVQVRHVEVRRDPSPVAAKRIMLCFVRALDNAKSCLVPLIVVVNKHHKKDFCVYQPVASIDTTTRILTPILTVHYYTGVIHAHVPYHTQIN